MRKTNLFFTPLGRGESTRSTVRCGPGASGASTPTRHALELLPPVDYLRMSYYERWFRRLAEQVVQYGLVTKEEMESGSAAPVSTKATPPFSLATSSRWLSRGIASSQDSSVRPLFKVGQRVRARNINPTGHTRLPRYARGKTGVIVRDHGVYRLSRHQRPLSGRETRSTSTRFVSLHGSCGGAERFAARLGSPRPVG